MSEIIRKTITTVTHYDFWEILSSTATALAAFGTLATVLKMSQQRKDSFKPKIVLSPPKNKIKRRQDDPYYHKYIPTDIPNIEVTNIGNGLAEFVHIISNTDIDNLLNKVKEIDIDNEFEITKRGFVSEINNSDKKTTEFLTDVDNYYEDIDIIEQTNSPNGNTGKTRFPYAYFKLAGIISYLAEKHNKYDVLVKIPPVTFKVDYKDIEGNKYSDEFILSLYRFSYEFDTRITRKHKQKKLFKIF